MDPATLWTIFQIIVAVAAVGYALLQNPPDRAARDADTVSSEDHPTEESGKPIRVIAGQYYIEGTNFIQWDNPTVWRNQPFPSGQPDFVQYIHYADQWSAICMGRVSYRGLWANGKRIWEATDLFPDIHGLVNNTGQLVWADDAQQIFDEDIDPPTLIGGKHRNPRRGSRTLTDFYGPDAHHTNSMENIGFDMVRYFAGTPDQRPERDERYTLRDAQGNIMKDRLGRDRTVPIPYYPDLAYVKFNQIGKGFSTRSPRFGFLVRRQGLDALGLGPVNRYEDNYIEFFWDCCTSRTTGIGMPEVLLDREEHVTIGAFLENETKMLSADGQGWGVAVSVDRDQKTLGKFLQEMSGNFGGGYIRDGQTGKLKPFLRRKDYEIEDLPILSPETGLMSIRSIALNDPDNNPNDIRVSYRNRMIRNKRDMEKHVDPALRLKGKQRRQRRINAIGVTGEEQAKYIAQQNFERFQQPLTNLSIVVTGEWLMGKKKNDVVRLQDPDALIDDMVVRIEKINYGDANSSSGIINVVEDVFSTEYTRTSMPRDGSLNRNPVAVFDNLPETQAHELPRYANFRLRSQFPQQTIDADNLDAARLNYLMICPNDSTRTFTAEYAERGTNGYATDISNAWCSNTATLNSVRLSSGTTQDNIPKTGHIDYIEFDNVSFPDLVQGNRFVNPDLIDRLFMIDNEIFYFENANIQENGNVRFTGIERERLDSTLFAHEHGARMWMFMNPIAMIRKWGTAAFEGNEELTVQFVPFDPRGAHRFFTREINLQDRAKRPMPPKAVTINGSENDNQDITSSNRQVNLEFKLESRDPDNFNRFARQADPSTIDDGLQLFAEINIGGRNVSTVDLTTNMADGAATLTIPQTGAIMVEVYTMLEGRRSLYSVIKSFNLA